jgi:AcrR family transcriptional regulator
MAEPYYETQKKITKESVFIALMKLLEKRAFSEITITEIAKVAGVSRAAFYRNYANKEDILIFCLRDLFQELLVKLQESENKSKLNRTVLFFSFFQEHSGFIETLIKAELSYIFYEQFCIYVIDFFENQTDKFAKSPLFEKYLPQYIASGLFRVLMEWIKAGTVESVNDITQFMFEVTGG